MMKCLQVCIHLFYTLSIVSSLRIQFDDVVGNIGSEDTTLRCAFTKSAGETVRSVVLSAQNISTGQFSQIALFLPDQDGILITGGKYLSGRVTLSYLNQLSTDVTATINDLHCYDETSFRCKTGLFSSAGLSYKEKSMNLTVAVNPSVPNIVWEDFSVSEGDIVTFTCIGSIGKPSGSFSWQKTVKDAEPSSYRNVSTKSTLVEDSCFYNGTSNLTIQVTDYDNDAVIRCSVNSSNDEVYYTETQALNVLYKVRTPSITRQPMEDEYRQGSGIIILTCIGRGNPKPSYKWFKDENLEEILNSSDTLYITEVITNNSGVYRCNVTNHVSGTLYTESTAVNILIVSEKHDTRMTTTVTIQKQHESESAEGIIFGVIAAVLLMALITVVILCWNINRKLRLELQNNYDNLRPRGYPEQGNRDVQYDGIILHNTSDVSQYENAEANDTQRTLGLCTNYENQRTGGGYEYAYVNPANEQSGPVVLIR